MKDFAMYFCTQCQAAGHFVAHSDEAEHRRHMNERHDADNTITAVWSHMVRMGSTPIAIGWDSSKGERVVQLIDVTDEHPKAAERVSYSKERKAGK